MPPIGWRSIARVLASFVLAILFFWCFIVLAFMVGRSAERIAVWTSVGLVLSPVFAYLALYKTRIALDYALALVIAVVLLVGELILLSILGETGTLSSPFTVFTFWPCFAANFAVGVWWTRGRPRQRLAK